MKIMSFGYSNSPTRDQDTASRRPVDVLL